MEEKLSFRRQYIDRLKGNSYLYEKDILSMLLSNAYSGRDMSDLAERLLSRFSSVRSVILAEFSELMTVEGVTKPIALYLITIGKAREKTFEEVKQIDDVESLAKAVGERLREFDSECAELYFVTRTGRVVSSYRYSSSLENKVSLNIQDIIAKITTERAYGFYLVHNHVTSKAQPSSDDDNFTSCLLSLNCGAKFLDHLIIGADGDWYSYKLNGRFN